MRLLALRIGRIRGIDVRVDVSALASLFCRGDWRPACSLSSRPVTLPRVWLAGSVAALVFLAGLLATS